MKSGKIKLDTRLCAIAGFVRKGARLADVGTDHAYLPVALVQSGHIEFAVASDVKNGPLESAKSTIALAGVEDKISVVLSNGLENINLALVDDIVIAGMGGELIWEIIKECPATKDERFNFVLQPMSAEDKLRRFLCENGFEIEKEAAVSDGKFIYCIIKASYSGNRFGPDRLFTITGKMVENKDEESKRYILKQYNKQLKKVQGLMQSSCSKDISEEVLLLEDLKRLVDKQ